VETKALSKAIAMLEARDWQGAHEIAQDNHGPLGAWAHGIAHLIEGDESNARYWYRLAKRSFPGMDAIDAEIAALKADLVKTG
jgi:hypothetical protein